MEQGIGSIYFFPQNNISHLHLALILEKETTSQAPGGTTSYKNWAWKIETVNRMKMKERTYYTCWS